MSDKCGHFCQISPCSLRAGIVAYAKAKERGWLNKPEGADVEAAVKLPKPKPARNPAKKPAKPAA
jgi:hypothetical protein